MFDTAGMEQLQAYIAAHGPQTDKEWSERLGISRSHFNMIRNGKVPPSRDLIAKIADVTEGAVAPAAWFGAAA